jgi:hypothetical protein
MPVNFPRGLDITSTTDMLSKYLYQKGMKQQQDEEQLRALSGVAPHFQRQRVDYSPQEYSRPTFGGVQGLTQPVTPSSVNFQTVPTTPSPSDFGFLSSLLNLQQAGGNAQPFMEAAKSGQGQFQTVAPGTTYGVRRGPQFTPQGITPFAPRNMANEDYLLRSEPKTVNGITKQLDVYGYKTPDGKEVITRQAYSDFTPAISGSGINAGAWVQTKDAMGKPTGFVNKITGEAKPLTSSAQELVGAPLSGTTKTMIETAPKVSELVARMKPMVDEVASQLGPVPGRWNAFMTGQVGTSDPKFNALRVNAGLLGTLLMRMHVGARGSEKIMEKFDELIGLGRQSPENLKSALDEIQAYANSVESEKMGIDTSKKPGPKIGDVEDGYKFKGGDPSDPNNWEKQ